MAVEIERKFLLANQQWRTQIQSRSKYIQGYMSRCPERTVRVRVADDCGWLTIKGKNMGAVRPEYEYPIPVADAMEMLAQLCEQPVIEKWRHHVTFNGHLWEIDEFLGANSGLIVAEIELQQEDEIFVRPIWLGAEVTDDSRYFNACLVSNPYCEW